MTVAEPPRNRRPRPYRRSGFYTAKRAVVKYGSRVLPGPETPMGRELRDWRLALIDQTVVQLYLVASLDAYVLSLPALVNKRSRSLFPIVRERTAQVNLLRDL